MARKQSDATKVRLLTRDYSLLHKEHMKVVEERNVAVFRLARAEREVVEWKARFDILLRREKNELRGDE